jgi:hypothetical protein
MNPRQDTWILGVAVSLISELGAEQRSLKIIQVMLYPLSLCRRQFVRSLLHRLPNTHGADLLIVKITVLLKAVLAAHAANSASG